MPKPSPTPQWLSIPERGLYTGIASFGSIGSGKTYGLILPAMRQVFAYHADDPARRLSGIVLEVKGDLCRQLQRILKWCGREQDYVEVSLDGNIRYNPLNNSLDAYVQAFNIASIITSIWGKGKEPFWQQSYTDLVRYMILLHRIRDEYLTMVDLFRTVISAGKLEAMLAEAGARFSATSYIGLNKDAYREHEGMLSPLGFEWNKDEGLYLIAWTQALENLLTQKLSTTFDVFTRKLYRPDLRNRFDSIQYWYWEHWKFFRSEVKTSIIQGIVVFLSLFETDPDVRRVLCPPKELYEGKPCASDPIGRVLPPFEELIESGQIVGLNFPVALNPALAKTIGTMMKIDYQRAVQLRIPKMDAHPERYFRPTVFICDEYQNFATVGGDNPTIGYPEVVTWCGALTFADLTHDDALRQRLIDSLEPLMPGGSESALIPKRRHVDDSVFGVIPLEIGRQTHDPRFIKEGQRWADRQWENPRTDGLSDETRFWIDDMYMLNMLQLEAYRATKDPKYLDRDAKEMVAYLDKLQQPNGLFYHGQDAPFFWGRGNGWVAAGMAEILSSLPENHPDRARILKSYRAMMAALLKYQGQDGVWRQLIDHPEAWPETSSSGMFTFALITGVKRGWLPSAVYGPAARKAWIAVVGYIDQNNDSTNVCVGTDKGHSVDYYLARPRETGNDHGQASILWAASALLR